jgi:uncharacterized membrane protein
VNDKNERSSTVDAADGLVVLGLVLVAIAVYLALGAWGLVGFVGLLFIGLGLVMARRNVVDRN